MMGEIKIEKMLWLLMDLQRFEKNKKLERIITQTKYRYLTNECELSDEELSVNAAGDIFRSKRGDDKRE